MMQVVRLVEFVRSGGIRVVDIPDDDLRTGVTVLFNMKKAVPRVCKGIADSSAESRRMALRPDTPIKSTGNMRPRHTKKPAERAAKSHVNLAVYDSTWETGAGQELERNGNVASWARNDHLVRRAIHVQGSPPRIPPGLSDPPQKRRHAGFGDQGD